ncbi:MAG: hypothetical protein H0W94_01275 [Actinobacteria bacterium]|nr:hypothetical protein [Actinomycetota bacterium]
MSRKLLPPSDFVDGTDGIYRSPRDLGLAWSAHRGGYFDPRVGRDHDHFVHDREDRVVHDHVVEGFHPEALDWAALTENGLPQIEDLREPYLPAGARIWAWGAG